MRLSCLVGFSLFALISDATLQIVPGATWTATNTGQHIQAHGGGVIKDGEKWYWIGEDKSNGTAFTNINCYSSINLVEWSYEGALISRSASGDTGPNRVIERPKVVHNKQTGKYIMWAHIDSADYGEAKVGVAIGDRVCGKYTYLRSERPLGFESRDSGVFIDDDGKGYLLTEDRRNGLRINALSDDYLNVSHNVYVWKEKYESPALIKHGGVYFMFASQLTGWSPNDNYYSTSKSLAGPWSAWKEFADSASNTYASQTSFVLPLGDGVVYMGDRWHSENLVRSTYVWLPLQISGSTARMANAVNWILDPDTGASRGGPEESAYEGETAKLVNGARSQACSSCSGSKAIGYLGGVSSGSATFSNMQSSATTRTTMRIKHLNGDKSPRYANISTNGKSQRVAFLPHGEASTASSVVHVDLKQGVNEVRISGIDQGWGPDIDRIFVPIR